MEFILYLIVFYGIATFLIGILVTGGSRFD